MLQLVTTPASASLHAGRILAGMPSDAEIEQFRQWFAKMLKSKSRITHTVLPWQAEIMFETNVGNRTLSLTRATRWAMEMRNGQWELTGEPVIFSEEGILNDGQTRLKACIIAGVPFTTHITFGIARRAFYVTGVGAKRSLADVFSIEGEKYATKLAGSLNWLSRYNNGMGRTISLSTPEGKVLLQEHPDIRNSCEIGVKIYAVTKLMQPSLAIFLHYIMALKSTDDADAFFDFLLTGLGATSPRDARHVLRERLISNRGAKAQIGEVEIAALTVKAWNAHRAKRAIGSLKWITNPAKGTPEEFPKVA